MNTRALLLIFLATSLVACDAFNKPKSTEEMPVTAAEEMAEPTLSADSIAMVNGVNISEDAFKAYSKQRRTTLHQHEDSSDTRLLQEYINLELVIQDAVKKGLDKNPDVKAQLELQRRDILSIAAFRDYVKQNPLTDEAMKSDYDARVKELTISEYKLRHILTEKEDTANKALAELSKGGDFAALVKKYSTGPSAKSGGDLGWQTEGDLVPEIRAAVKDLKPGNYVDKVVKTRFGWHVIFLDERRDTPPPPFAEVKERVRDVLQRQQIIKYIASLRQKASIVTPEAAAPADSPAPGKPPLDAHELGNKNAYPK